MIDFEPTETQRLMMDTAHDFGKEVAGPAEVELDLMASPEQVFKSDRFWGVIGQAFELGFNKMAIPEHMGGLGLDPQTIGLVWEELARWAPGVVSTLIPGAVVPQLVAFLAPDRKDLVERFVTPYCEDSTGKKISAWCSSEPEVGSDGKNYYDKNVRHHTDARKKDGKFYLTGTKSDFVSNGGIADSYIVFGCVDPSLGIKGSGAFVLPADTPGLTTGRSIDKIGLRALNQSAVFFDEVEVPEEWMIFPPGELYPMLHNSIITVGNLGVGYIAVGLMRGAFEYALEHSKNRVQWGAPIFKHQLIAKKLFECHQAIEASRTFLYKGSWLATKNFPGDLKTSLAAKVFATEMAAKHTAEMVQVLGGYGISKEYPVEKFARDAYLLKIMDGTNETLMVKAAEHL